MHEGVSHKLWTIIYHQLKKVDFSKEKDQFMTEIMINSLKIVEEEFNTDLPLNKQAITYYLQQKYLNKF